MMNQLDHETKYMLYEPGERIRDIVRVEALILWERNWNRIFQKTGYVGRRKKGYTFRTNCNL